MKAPLEKNEIGKFLSATAKTAGLHGEGKQVTNHSVRKSCISRFLDADVPENFVYPIHTEIFAPKINEINFIPVRDCWLLISRTVFVTSEKYRPTNHRPRTALCH